MAERIITSRDGQVVSLKLQGEVFISAYAPASKSGCATVIACDRLDKAALHGVLDEFTGELQAPLSRLEIKVVGPASGVEKAKQLLEGEGITPATAATTNSDRFEVLFYTTQGRVRLADGPAPQKIKVLVVDDSVTVRRLLSKVISGDPGLEVVATAERPSQVDELIRKHRPNVITLDIHMPEMDGVELLKTIVPKYRIPTIMITSISKDEGPKVLEALEAGAVDYIQKPSLDDLDRVTAMIVDKIKGAAGARLSTAQAPGPRASRPAQRSALSLKPGAIVAIGSSTGGTEALRHVLTRLPEHIPPIVIVQHIPAGFSKALAVRLNDLCPFEVKEAEHGDEIRPGRVLIAPGGLQMKVRRSGGKDHVVIEDAPPVNRHKPSVDVLFESVAREFGKSAIGVILTGMGSDGAKGLLSMKQAGARTIAQDEETCVVFGMPREAIRAGAVDAVLSLFDISERLIEWLCADHRAA